MSAYPNPALSPDSRPDLRPDAGRIARLRQMDRLRGLVIVGATFVLCLLISVWAKRRSLPVLSLPPAPPSSVGVVGFPNSVDSVKSLARARQLSQRNLLRTITADGVKSDGTVDVTTPNGRIRYGFQSAMGEGAEPPRQPDTLARHPYCGRQNILVGKEGMFGEPDDAGATCAPHPLDPLPEPHCSTADVWAHAIGRGVPKERLAHIEYYRAVGGPAWRFEAPHPRGRFTLYGDCQRELDPKDAIAAPQ
ncbi:MAG TPA: hypothetical protein VER96_07370 [Polyangiaceae bacterium]|nr:hypothetical protein [Polyangiaceae bacterium]